MLLPDEWNMGGLLFRRVRWLWASFVTECYEYMEILTSIKGSSVFVRSLNATPPFAACSLKLRSVATKISTPLMLLPPAKVLRLSPLQV